MSSLLNRFDKDGLEARLAGYLAVCAKAAGDHWKKMNFKFAEPPKFELEPGSRFVKIVKVEAGGSRSVHSFIDRANGDILKAASYRAPAKHARGNVFEPDYGAKSAKVSCHGVRYL